MTRRSYELDASETSAFIREAADGVEDEYSWLSNMLEEKIVGNSIVRVDSYEMTIDPCEEMLVTVHYYIYNQIES